MDLQLDRTSRVLVTGGTRGIGRAIVRGVPGRGGRRGVLLRPGHRRDRGHRAGPRRPAGPGQRHAGRRRGRPGARRVGDRLGRAAGRPRHRGVQRQRPGDPGQRGELAGLVRGRPAAARCGWSTAALPHLQASDAASIVAVSSVSGREIDFAAGPYGTMKAALVHYVSGLAYQLAAQGVRANTVSPGNTFFEGGVWDQIQTGNPELYATALGLNPTGRMGTPRGDGRRGGVPGQPAVELHLGDEPGRGRCADPRRAAVGHAGVPGPPARPRRPRGAASGCGSR